MEDGSEKQQKQKGESESLRRSLPIISWKEQWSKRYWRHLEIMRINTGNFSGLNTAHQLKTSKDFSLRK